MLLTHLAIKSQLTASKITMLDTTVFFLWMLCILHLISIDTNWRARNLVYDEFKYL